MKFCPNCGTEIKNENAVICLGCGCSFERPAQVQEEKKLEQTISSREKVALAFMIITTIISGFLILPLAWCLPMTIYYWSRLSDKKPVSVSYKICVLIFVNLISGILMLCSD